MSYKPSYRSGDWKALCDRCGFTYKASQLKETWDNLKVCKECWEPRQPQDLVRAVRDDQSVPWTRSQICPTNAADTVLAWVERDSGVTVNLRSVWHESGMWVICGDSGTILTSTDSGLSWTARTSGVTTLLRTVKYWNSNWYIVGRRGAATRATILKSPDAITWTDLSSAAALKTDLVDIAFNDSTLVFVGWETEDFTGQYYKSTDGVNFTSFSINSTEYGYGVVWNSSDSLWGVVGSNNGDPAFNTSPDLITWTQRTVTGAVGELWTIEHDGTNWLIAENLTKIYTSPDLTTWTRQTENDMNTDNPWRLTRNDQGVILLSGGFVIGKIILSIDGGVTWAITYQADTTVLLMSKTVYGGSTWVGVGWNGRIVTGNHINNLRGIPAGTFTVIQLPVANAGGDQSVIDGNPATLDGSLSSDPQGHALTYLWTQTAGTSVALSSPTAVSPTFISPLGEDVTLVFSLVVNDGVNDSGPDYVSVNSAREAGAWDVTNASYDVQAFQIGAQDDEPEGLWVSPDGSMIFMVGAINDTVFRYDMSTPGDITTATVNSNSLDLTTWATKPTGLTFKVDGLRLFVIDYGSSTVYSFTLSIPWDLSTAVYDNKSSTVATTSPQALFIDTSGVYLYAQSHFDGDFIRYSMSIPWDLSTTSPDAGQTFRAGSDLVVTDFYFKYDGSRLYALSLNFARVYQWDLSTNWDLTTTGSRVSYNLAIADITARGLAFNYNGTSFYVVGWSADTIQQYNISL